MTTVILNYIIAGTALALAGKYFHDYILSYNGLINYLMYGDDALRRGYTCFGCPIPGSKNYEEDLKFHWDEFHCELCFVVPVVVKSNITPAHVVGCMCLHCK